MTRAAAALDLLLVALAFLAVTAVKGLTLKRALGIDPRRIPPAAWGDWRVYLVELWTPALLLPAQSLLLARRGQGWADLGLRPIPAWGPFLLRVAALTAALVALNALLRWSFGRSRAALRPSPYLALSGHPRAFLAACTMALLSAGLTEELTFRGLVLDRLAVLLAGAGGGLLWAVVLVALAFGLAHAAHGPLSMLNAAVAGLAFGFAYLFAGRDLWLVVAAHSLYDVIRLGQYARGGGQRVYNGIAP